MDSEARFLQGIERQRPGPDAFRMESAGLGCTEGRKRKS